MLLHIGENNFVDADKTILILNIESISVLGNKTNLKSHNRSSISKNESKSLIVLEDNQILESPIDSKTLRKRDDFLAFNNESNSKHK